MHLIKKAYQLKGCTTALSTHSTQTETAPYTKDIVYRKLQFIVINIFYKSILYISIAMTWQGLDLLIHQ